MTFISSNRELAKRISEISGEPVQTIKVEMVGSKDITDLLRQIQVGRAKAHTRPMKLGFV